MKKIIAIGVLFSCLGIASAQTGKSVDGKASQTTFQPGWYMSLYTGYNLFLGEGNNFFQSGNSVSLRKNGSPLSTFGLGYDFNPVIGLRGELGWARYHWNQTSPVTKVTNPYWWGVNLTGDLTVNLSNWWGGFNPKRVFDVQAFVGIGAGERNAGQIDTKKRFTPIVRGGLIGNFHLSKQFDVNAELATNAYSDKFNGVKKSLCFDDMTSFQVGFTYHFKERYTEPAPVPQAAKPIIKEKVVVKHDTIVKEVIKHDTIVKAAPSADTFKKCELVAKRILFVTGKTTLLPKSKKTIMELVKLLNTDKDIHLAINGHSDNVGNPNMNQKLSERRAQAVKDFLVSKGIDESRLTATGFGDTKPIATNKTVQGRKLNRRVELIPSY